MNKHYLPILLLMSALMALSSCAAIKTYHREEVPYADSLIRISFQQKIDSSQLQHFSVSDYTWRSMYTDAMLIRLLEEGLANNLDLKIAQARIEQAEAYLKKAKAAYAPTLGLNASGEISQPLGTVGQGTLIQSYSLGASTTWELDIWGKITAAKRSKYAAYMAQQSSKQAVTSTLIANLAGGYYTLIALDTERALVEQTIINRTEYLGTVKSLMKSAQTTQVAVLQAQAQLSEAQSYLPQIEMAIQKMENTLCLLLGKPSQPIARTGKIPIYTVTLQLGKVAPDPFPTNLSSLLLENRPDVREAEYGLMRYFNDWQVAKAAMYPSFSLSADISATSQSFATWFAMPASLIWSALANLAQPLFNGRALRTQREAARKDFEVQLYTFRKAVLNAGMETSNALLQTKALQQQMDCVRTQCESLKQAYEFSTELFLNGYMDYLDVLTAQSDLFSSERSYIELALSKIKAQIELFRALGGGAHADI